MVLKFLAFSSGKVLNSKKASLYSLCEYLWAQYLEIGKQRKVGGKVQAERIQIGGTRF
jgi:hypothetical protein